MAATPKTNNFMLGQGTVMLAPFAQGAANLAYDMNPEDNSIGLIKNIKTGEESSNVELRAGVRQGLIDSQKSGVKVTVSYDVFEYTAQNLLYSQSLARDAKVVKGSRLAAAPAAAGTTLNLSGTAPSGSYTPLALTDLTAGTVLMIRGSGAATDVVFITRVTVAPTALTAVTVSPAIPADMTFLSGDAVFTVNTIPVGSLRAQDFFSMKVVGTLANEDKPVVMVYPKVKITKGFNLDFTEENYGNMSWEVEPYFMTSADIGNDWRLQMIGTDQLAGVHVGF